jgi:hypothetical protein
LPRRIQVEGMRIAGNTLQQRLDDEVMYYRQEGDLDPYGINVSRMDSLGAGSPTLSILLGSSRRSNAAS